MKSETNIMHSNLICGTLTEELFLFLCWQFFEHLPEGHDVRMISIIASFIHCVLFGKIKNKHISKIAPVWYCWFACVYFVIYPWFVVLLHRKCDSQFYVCFLLMCLESAWGVLFIKNWPDALCSLCKLRSALCGLTLCVFCLLSGISLEYLHFWLFYM